MDGIVLKNVKLAGETGLTIGYANVSGTGLNVQAAQGEGIIKTAGGNLTTH